MQESAQKIKFSKNHLDKKNMEVNYLNLFSRETILVKQVQY